MPKSDLEILRSAIRRHVTMPVSDQEMQIAALILEALDRDGYVIVPKEPTQTMLCAGHDSAERVANRSIHQPIAPAMWAAMIAKADK